MESVQRTDNYLSQVTVKWNGRLEGKNGTQYRVVCYTGKGKGKALEGTKWKALSETCLETLQRKQPGISTSKDFKSSKIEGDDFKAVSQFLTGKMVGFDHVEIEKVPITTRLFEALFGGFVRRSQANKLTEQLSSVGKFTENDLKTLNAQFKEDSEFIGVVNDFLDAKAEGKVDLYGYFEKVSEKLSKVERSTETIKSFLSLYMPSEITPEIVQDRVGKDFLLHSGEQEFLQSILSDSETYAFAEHQLVSCRELRMSLSSQKTQDNFQKNLNSLLEKLDTKDQVKLKKIIDRSEVYAITQNLLGKDYPISEALNGLIKRAMNDPKGAPLLQKSLIELSKKREESLKLLSKGEPTSIPFKVGVNSKILEFQEWLLPTQENTAIRIKETKALQTLQEKCCSANSQVISDTYNFAVMDRKEMVHNVIGHRYLANPIILKSSTSSENQKQLTKDDFKKRSDSTWERIDYAHDGARPDGKRHLFSKGWYEFELANDMNMEKIKFRVKLDLSRFTELYGKTAEEKKENCQKLMEFVGGYCNAEYSEKFFKEEFGKLEFISSEEDKLSLQKELQRFDKEANLKLDQVVVSLGDPRVNFDGLTRTKPLPKQS